MENAPEEKGLVVPPEPPVTVHKNASWGAIISIFVILAMIIVGAFYAWGKRVAEEHPTTSTTAPSSTHKS